MHRWRTWHRAAACRAGERNNRNSLRGLSLLPGSNDRTPQHCRRSKRGQSQKTLNKNSRAFRLGDVRPALQDVIVLQAYLLQNLHSAQAEQVQIESKPPADHADKRQTLAKEIV